MQRLEAIMNDVRRYDLEVSIDGVAMFWIVGAQETVLVGTQFQVRLLDQVVHRRGRRLSPFLRRAKYHSRDQSMIAAHEFLPCRHAPLDTLPDKRVRA